MTYHQELQHRLFQQQEEQVHHMEYQQEFQYYEDVANGRLDRIHLQLLQPNDIVVYNDGEYGMLSKDPLRNLRYHFVVSVAMITRLCVEHGLEQELAYTMSDLYINKMDELQQAEAIISLQNDMLLDFTQKMADLPKRNGYSIHVIKGIEYICRHLHQRLTVAEVSAALSVNRSYFSALFAKPAALSASTSDRKNYRQLQTCFVFQITLMLILQNISAFLLRAILFNAFKNAMPAHRQRSESVISRKHLPFPQPLKCPKNRQKNILMTTVPPGKEGIIENKTKTRGIGDYEIRFLR